MYSILDELGKPLHQIKIRDELARYSYKPGKFNLTVNEYSGIPNALCVIQRVPNTYDPSTMSEVASLITLDPYLIERVGIPAALQRLVREMVQNQELHEVDEWLRYDGQILNNPHAQDYTPPGVHNTYRES